MEEDDLFVVMEKGHKAEPEPVVVYTDEEDARYQVEFSTNEAHQSGLKATYWYVRVPYAY